MLHYSGSRPTTLVQWRSAYPASYIWTWEPEDAATALLERIDVSAVAVPTARVRREERRWARVNRVSGWPIDRAPCCPKGGGHGLTLPTMLCTDIPWWPLGLTNVDAMAAWRPGDPLRRLKATDDQRAAEWLIRAGSGAGAAVESVFTTIAAWLDYQI